MNYLPRMLQMLKKIRYFYSLFSENLRLAQNLPNEVFLTISDFKVDIPYTEILRISLLHPLRIILIFATDWQIDSKSSSHTC